MTAKSNGLHVSIGVAAVKQCLGHVYLKLHLHCQISETIIWSFSERHESNRRAYVAFLAGVDIPRQERRSQSCEAQPLTCSWRSTSQRQKGTLLLASTPGRRITALPAAVLQAKLLMPIRDA
jgi:hypothetical protein